MITWPTGLTNGAHRGDASSLWLLDLRIEGASVCWVTEYVRDIWSLEVQFGEKKRSVTQETLWKGFMEVSERCSEVSLG